jgi:polysaccharide pyruvyl transferase WcaK-like protein
MTIRTDGPGDRGVAFITPSGWGNLGDAAIVDSLVHAVRRRRPGAPIVGYTLHHVDTATRHGVTAHPLTAFSLPYYPALPEGSDPDYELPTYDGSQAPAAVMTSPPAGIRSRIRSSLRGRMWTVRAVGIAAGAARVRAERSTGARRRAELAGFDTIAVAGGGQLDALFGGVWGQPFVLWRWARVARSIDARFVVLSVGTGTLDRLERAVTVGALRRADYRSYRDEGSRSLLATPELTHDDPIVPDLAYALPLDPLPLPADGPIVVGVSPMNYQHPDFYPAARAHRFDEHIEGMRRICELILEQGHHVELFTTDASDDVALAALADRLHRTVTARGDQWSIAGARTVDDLMQLYGRVHAVVASRLHGALLAHVAHRPVLALAHERKVRALMTDAGHARFCFDLGQVDPVELDRRLAELIDDRTTLAAEVAATSTRLRDRVEQQYDAVFGPATT